MENSNTHTHKGKKEERRGSSMHACGWHPGRADIAVPPAPDRCTVPPDAQGSALRISSTSQTPIRSPPACMHKHTSCEHNTWELIATWRRERCDRNEVAEEEEERTRHTPTQCTACHAFEYWRGISQCWCDPASSANGFQTAQKPFQKKENGIGLSISSIEQTHGPTSMEIISSLATPLSSNRLSATVLPVVVSNALKTAP